MKFNFPSIDKYIAKDDCVVRSSPRSKEYVNIPQLMATHGPGLLAALKMRLPILPRMIGCMRESKLSAKSITLNPKSGKTQISNREFKELEAFIKTLDIDMIGYTHVPAEYIFKGHTILYGKAIILVMEMRHEEMETAPSKRALKEVFRSYYGLGVAVNRIADYMRERGFNVMAAPAVGGDVSYVPLAEMAGMGVIGRHGLLITDRPYGVSLRLVALFTDIENLPYADPTKNKHLWVKEFCKQCGKCVKVCPSEAIYPEMLPSKRCIDQTKCAIPFSRLNGCSLCIKNCTFFGGEAYHKIHDKFCK